MMCSAYCLDIIFVISSQTPCAAVMESSLEIPAPEKRNPLEQWFSNFFWSRTICVSRTVIMYHLFQKKSMCQISVDQKSGKPELTQMQREQNGCEKF